MMKRTIRQFDIRHTGDEMDRLEILWAFRAVADIVNGALLAGITVESVKTDLICVTIEEIDTM